MEIIVLLLIIVILFLISYLLLEKREFRRIDREIQELKKNDTNSLLHSEFPSKKICKLIMEYNLLRFEVQKDKILLEQKKKNLNQMMANISHDLRTPLTSALGYIDLLLTVSTQKDKKELQIIQDRLYRLEELIGSFFEFSKMNMIGNIPERTPVSIVALLEQSIAHFYQDFNKEKRKIKFVHPKQGYILTSNETMLLRIFDNLICNAHEHGKGTLQITITDSDMLEISFANPMHGPIMIDHIFDQFYTVDIARTKNHTGLGLAIVKEFTEQLQGRVEAKMIEDHLQITLKFPYK